MITEYYYILAILGVVLLGLELFSGSMFLFASGVGLIGVAIIEYFLAMHNILIDLILFVLFACLTLWLVRKYVKPKNNNNDINNY